MIAPAEGVVFDPHPLEILANLGHVAAQGVHPDMSPLRQQRLVEKGLISLLRKNPLKTLSKLLRRELLSGVAVHLPVSVVPFRTEIFVSI